MERIFFILLAILIFGVMIASIPLYRRVQEGLDQLTRLTREHLTGARVIRAFTDEENEIKTFKEQNTALTAVQKFAGKISFQALFRFRRHPEEKPVCMGGQFITPRTKKQ